LTAAQPLVLLLAQIAVVLVASRLLGLVLRPLGQPLVVAEILTGIALGPSLLGVVRPEWLEALFPASGLPALNALSQVGLVLFMFTVGLELDIDLLRRRGRDTALVSAACIVLPFSMGFVFGWVTHGRFAPAGVGVVPFALFIGASLAVTAFPVLARILGEAGLLGTRVGVLALGAAAINDVAAWVLLAFVLAATGAHDLVGAVRHAVGALVFVALMFWVVRPFLMRLELRFGTVRGLGQRGVAIVFILLLACAIVAEWLGLHALFGAFLFGAAIPRHRNAAHALSERIADVTVVLLLPLFFASTGLRTHLDLLPGSAWITCAAVVATASLGKVAGAALPARLCGLAWRDAFALGVLMNTRGLMELVILTIGLETGVLTPELFAILVVMAVATTLVTGPAMRILLPRDRVREELDQAANPMSPPLLVCVSRPGSAPGLARIAAGLLAGRASEACALHVVPIEEGASIFPASDESTGEESAGELLSRLAAGLGARVEAISFASADPVDGIVRAANLRGADPIVLGLHRPLLGTARLGGPLVGVVGKVDADVCMFHDAGLRHLRRILLATGCTEDAAATRIADRLANAPGTRLTRLHLDHDATRVEKLLAVGRQYDLVVVGAGAEWELPMHLFELRNPRLVTELKTSLLAVASGRSAHPRSPATQQA
jgi:Kef-type K+ transport system membrane component KefB